MFTFTLRSVYGVPCLHAVAEECEYTIFASTFNFNASIPHSLSERKNCVGSCATYN